MSDRMLRVNSTLREVLAEEIERTCPVIADMRAAQSKSQGTQMERCVKR